MFPNWLPLYPAQPPVQNRDEESASRRQLFQNGWFAFQQDSASGMWQQQQQFFSPSFGGISTYPDTQQPKTIRPPICKTKTDTDYHVLLPSDCMIQQSSSNHLCQGRKQRVCSLSSQKEKFNNTSYDQSPLQQQYASYPPGAIYRRTSGPGWQQQQVSYPPL